MKTISHTPKAQAASTPGRRTILAVLIAGLSAPALAASPVVISQVYGGGGNSGATLKNDFIELFNRGDQPVSLAGWSVQYASASGSSWQVSKISGSPVLQPGQYYLVQEAAGTGAGAPLTPDTTGTIPMSGTTGKVALVSDGNALSGAAPAGATLVDLLGYNAGYFEGTNGPGLSNTTRCAPTAAAPTPTTTAATSPAARPTRATRPARCTRAACRRRRLSSPAARPACPWRSASPAAPT